MKIILLILVSGFALLPLMSQSYTYEFGYDASGNRISRTIIFPPQPSPAYSSLDTALNNRNNSTDILREDLADGGEIIIYPNPAKGELVVEVRAPGTEVKGSIIIYSSNGSLVYKQDVLSEMTLLDVSGFLPGNYILQISLDDMVRTYKIIKQ